MQHPSINNNNYAGNTTLPITTKAKLPNNYGGNNRLCENDVPEILKTPFSKFLKTSFQKFCSKYTFTILHGRKMGLVVIWRNSFFSFIADEPIFRNFEESVST
jgi:hypothetical protein